MSQSQYDLVVVGAGIAGLAIAEIFASSGQRVALVEKNHKVCQESSGAHHEWFHFGSLYSIFPNNQFMRTLVGGIDDLLAYYRNFPGMNVRVGNEGKLTIRDEPGKWIREDTIDYIVTARNDPDFSLSRFDGVFNYAKKLFFLLVWEMAIKQFIARHQRFHKFDWRSGQASEWVPKAGWTDYSRDVIFHVTELDAKIDKNTHFRVPGFDRPMDSYAIIRSLLQSFLSRGGDLLMGSGASGYESDGDGPVEVKLDNGKVVRANRVIFTSGKTLQHFMHDTGLRLNVIGSPLLAVYPQVCRQNFVRLTPFMQKTVNHICHTANGEPYSLIGGGYFADADDPRGLDKSRRDLIAMAKSVFPKIKQAKVVETYVSYKAELVNRAGERNYQYQVKQIAKNTFVAIPGKFSLAFSLAVNAYKNIMGSEPPPRSQQFSNIDVSHYMVANRHRQIILDHLARS